MAYYLHWGGLGGPGYRVQLRIQLCVSNVVNDHSMLKSCAVYVFLKLGTHLLMGRWTKESKGGSCPIFQSRNRREDPSCSVAPFFLPSIYPFPMPPGIPLAVGRVQLQYTG